MTWTREILRSLLLFINLHFPLPGRLTIPQLEEIHREIVRKEKKKKRKRLSDKLRPRVKRKEIKNQNYLRTSAKDARYSNQRKLRRMYRNS